MNGGIHYWHCSSSGSILAMRMCPPVMMTRLHCRNWTSGSRRRPSFLLTASAILMMLVLALFLPSVDGRSHSSSVSNQHDRIRSNGGHHGRRSIKMSSTTTTTATWLEADSEEDIKTTDSDKNSIIHLKSKNNDMSLIEAPLSGTIFLHCPVQLDEDFQVSWVRLPDWRIVASGRHVYSHKDVERFKVLAPSSSGQQQAESASSPSASISRSMLSDSGESEGSNSGAYEWTLQIKYASMEDQGLYECQVATGTGIVTHYFNVSVVKPMTTIMGLGLTGGAQFQSEYHVDKGSVIQLSCLIHNIPQVPQFIFWYHNDRMINYDDSTLVHPTAFRRLPRVQVITDSGHEQHPSSISERNKSGGADERVVTSQLTIRNVTLSDSGNYTCAPSNAGPASTIVYVSEGDDAAAAAIQVGLGESSNVSDVVMDFITPAAASSSSSASSKILPMVTLLIVSISRCHFHHR